MTALKDIREKLRAFNQVTQIPVNLVENDRSLYSIPDNISYISDLVKDSGGKEELFSVSDGYYNKTKSYYHMNDFDECFILLSIPENLRIIAGPVISGKLHEGSINNIIRLNKLPIKLKSKLMNYYDNLPVLDTNRYYYCGKLLELLFDSTVPKAPVENYAKEGTSISDEYFSEMIKNRETLFHHPPYFHLR